MPVPSRLEIVEGAGHFLQEDRGPELARVIVDFVRSTVDG